MAVGGSDLPPPLEAFLASVPTLDVLLSPHQYRGGGDVARKLRAAAAEEPAAVGAFAAALFAKVKSFPEAAAALAAANSSGGKAAAAGGGPLLDCLLRQLDPVLQALKHLARPAERARIPTKLMLGCLSKLEPVQGAPDFWIDRYGLAISSLAVCPNPFAWHVDHRVPVACGGATDAGNLDAVQHRFNHCKSDRLIDPELHRWEILGQMAPHTYVTAGQLQQLAAELEAQGKEPSYRNVMARLCSTEPWSALFASNSSSEAAVQSEVGRLATGRRQRHEWSAEEEEKLAAAVFHASKRALDEMGRGVRTGRISWKGVAAELDSGRSGEQCKGKWRGPRLAADAPEGESGQESEDESEEEDGAQRQQPLRGYTFWSEAEADTAAQLLGAVGARLERDRGFARTARSLPDKLRAACQELWQMPLAQRLPERTLTQVKDKCCGMVEFAIEVARNKQKFKKRQANRGLTVQQWRHIAPHLLLLAEQLPLKSEVRKLVASEEHKQEVEDVPRHVPPAASSALGAVGRGRDPPGSSRSSSSGGCYGRGRASTTSSSNSRGRGGSSRQAAPKRTVLAATNQQPAAAAASGRRRATEEERQGIYKLWLRHNNRWELIRQQVERDPALCSFLEGCSDKTKAQVRLKDLARNCKWSFAAGQQPQQRADHQLHAPA